LDNFRFSASRKAKSIRWPFRESQGLRGSPGAAMLSGYLDTTRNARGQAVAVAYSVRPYPGATVSTPLKWSEVRKGLDPSKYTIKTMLKRIDKLGDLWEPVLGPGIDLAGCVEQLATFGRSSKV